MQISEYVTDDASTHVSVELSDSNAAQWFLNNAASLEGHGLGLQSENGNEHIEILTGLAQELEKMGAFESSLATMASCSEYSVSANATASGLFGGGASADASASGCSSSSNFAYADAESDEEADRDSDSSTGSATASASASVFGPNCRSGASASTSVGPSKLDSDIC